MNDQDKKTVAPSVPGDDVAFLKRRYEYVRNLGQGAQGTVHLVRDGHFGDRLLAVKTLLPRADEEWRKAFRHEFEVLAGLKHPRLGVVHDFGTFDDGRIYFTRDYVVGDDLTVATAGMDLNGIIALAVEICRALKPLHHRGLMHGDLKPGNIICSPDGIAYLIDFSFVRSTGDSSIPKGTVQYMAPEIIENRLCDSRADLYALGATIYDVVCGEPPFEGSTQEIILGHLSDERPRPVARKELIKDTTSKKAFKDLAVIIERLLSRRADDRFPDILEVEAALTTLAPKAVIPDPLPDYPMTNESNWVQELRQCRLAVKRRLDFPSGMSPLWSVEGELGTGKSAFLRAIKWWAQLEGITTVEAICSPGTMLAPIAQLVNQLLSLLGDEVSSPVGNRLLESLTRPETAETNLDGLVLESSKLLLQVAHRSPLVVFIDDVDQASFETLHFIRGLITSITANTPIAILAAAARGFDISQQLGPCEGIVLPVLGEVQIASLCESFFGKTEPAMTRRILAHTGGNPLFVITILRDLVNRGMDVGQLEELGAPRKLEKFWLDKLHTLSKESRKIVEAAAVLGRPAVSDELAQVAQVSKKQVGKLLPALHGEGWICRNHMGWHITTKLISDEIRNATASVELPRYHERAFNIEPVEAKKFLHAARAGKKEVLKKKGRKVAASLEHLGALHSARELLTQMEYALGDDPLAVDIALDLGRICLAQGDYPAAEDRLQFLEKAKDQQIARRALLLLGRLNSLRFELDKASNLLGRALKIGNDPKDQARALLELANVELKRRNTKACVLTATKGLECALPKDPVRADLLSTLASASSQAGNHDDAIVRAREAVSVARSIGDQRSIALALDMLAWVGQQSGDLQGATENLEQASRLNRKIGDIPRLRRDQLTLGTLKFWLESWPEALEHFEEASRLARAVANPVKRVEVQAHLGMILAKVGRFERAMLFFKEFEQEAKRLKQDELVVGAQTWKAEALGGRGEIDQAVDLYREAIAAFEKLGNQSTIAEAELEIAEWFLWRGNDGDIEEADLFLNRAKGRDRKVRGRLFEQRLRLLQGNHLLCSGEVEAGMTMLGDLAEPPQERGLKDIAWKACVAIAKAHIKQGKDYIARRKLRQAIRILDELAAGFSKEHKLAFWQDVRRSRVRKLLSATSSSASHLSGDSAKEETVDSEAKALYRILDFNKRLLSEHQLPRLLDAILDSAIELTRAERGFVLMVGENGLDVNAARQSGHGEVEDPYERFSNSIAESVYLDGEPVITIDAMGDDRFNEFLSIHELRLKSVACLPVQFRGRALGVLYLENRLRVGRFGADDLRVLSAFADQVAIAISQAQLIEESKNRQDKLEQTQKALEEALAKQTAALNEKTTDLKLAHDQLERTKQRLLGADGYHGIVGSGSAMSRIFSLVERVKNLDIPVVILGASGTGKDLLARVLHEVGNRKLKPFVVINCGSIPETLVETTLFGHVKGAFSGASGDREGMLAMADGGTLYLDGIEDMPARMQVDLLRVLQEGSYSPIGSTDHINVNIRLVISSRTPLEQLASQGLLREDLMYRLQVVAINLPPLCERTEDIPVLARQILKRESEASSFPARQLSSKALEALLGYKWPGNIRELEQAIRRALVVGEGSDPISVTELFPGSEPKTKQVFFGEDLAEKDRITIALERCKWNRTKAAAQIGMPRRTFYRKLEKYGLAHSKS